MKTLAEKRFGVRAPTAPEERFPLKFFSGTPACTELKPAAIAAQDSEARLWARVRQAAYLEPYGAPFTRRQFTSNDVYSAGCKQNEIRHDKTKIKGILNYLEMRYESGRAQLEELRKTIPLGAATAGFPTTMKPLPGKA